jgi:hypothetical protein
MIVFLHGFPAKNCHKNVIFYAKKISYIILIIQDLIRNPPTKILRDLCNIFSKMKKNTWLGTLLLYIRGQVA